MLKFFKKLCEQKEKACEEAVSELNLPLEEKKVSSSISENMVFCRQLFSGMDIIRYRTITAKGGQNLRFFLVFCDGMVNTKTINDNIICPLTAC
ncbi:MAG: spore germination protein, partial [Clostridiales bacterium]|nr:spore germination protein [Clostridiales bacterium]